MAASQTMIKDPNVLMKRWMVVYMNLNILRSTNPEVQSTLDEMKGKLAECNEYVMRFFDMVDADPEKVSEMTTLRPHDGVKCPKLTEEELDRGLLMSVGKCNTCDECLELRRPWRGFITRCNLQGKSDSRTIEYG